MKTIQDLTPKGVWKNFYLLTQIPRPSYLSGPITKFLLDFGKNLGLEAFTDDIGNVIIRKPASSGMEDRKGVIIQGHMDMVPQKNNDTEHNFETDPIQTYVDEDWVKARGTTLGADNGLGVAAMMSILEDDTLKHGPLEMLITKDEEVGMIGAFGLKPDVLQGEILLNLDSEDEGDLYIGCAGGTDVIATLEYKETVLEENDEAYMITLKGLKGGHSGMEINEGRANANKLLVRIIRDAVLYCEARLVSWEGGNMRNAIPREAHAILTVPKDQVEPLKELLEEYQIIFNDEFGSIENKINILIEQQERPQYVIPEEIQDNFIQAVYACHNGVLRMIPDIPNVVETSSNLAIVKIGGGQAMIEILARSSSDSMKEFLVTSLEACFSMAGMKVELSGNYSGWQPHTDSPILQLMKNTYEELYAEVPNIQVIHAGLECGIIGAIYPSLDMISFGPTIRSPHSPDERTYIPSVEKFYNFLVSALEKTPKK